ARRSRRHPAHRAHAALVEPARRTPRPRRTFLRDRALRGIRCLAGPGLGRAHLQRPSHGIRSGTPMDRASHRPLIAVVDDNDDNCVLLHALLDDRYDLTVFHDGPSALEKLEEQQPHLALLDVSLPGMDGVEVLHRMRRLEGLALVPAIALTAHTMPGDRERLLAAGFDDY